MTKSVLVILGHPNSDSFCGAVARSYLAGAQDAGIQNAILDLSRLNFEPILKYGHAQEQPLEPDLQNAQTAIAQADHLVWVYPNWWGSPPSLLQGFIERTFLPGFAFKYHRGPIPQKLLKGKSSHVLMTMDTPIWFYRFGMGAAGIKVMKDSVLNFSGIKPIQTTLMGPLRNASLQQRNKWLKQAFEAGKRGL